MKKFLNWRIILIIILSIILIVMFKTYLKNEQKSSFSGTDNFASFANSNALQTASEEASKINSSSEVTSALSENLELHATYYLEECYVQENQEVKQGENILKYTNGEYLTAPYDCVITEISVPEEGEECTNNNYITISSLNNLAVQVKIDEDKISNFEVGDVATITISALDDKEFEGNITKISSTASNGSFTVTIEFENDGDIKIGMSAKVEIEY